MTTCKKCGAALRKGDIFCASCGAENAPTAGVRPPLPRDHAHSRPFDAACLARKIAGLVIGVIILVFGFSLLSFESPTAWIGNESWTSTSFGGDFYSYMYKVTGTAVDQLCNIADGMENMTLAAGKMTRAILRGISFLLISAGMIVIWRAAFLPLKRDRRMEEKLNETNRLLAEIASSHADAER